MRKSTLSLGLIAALSTTGLEVARADAMPQRAERLVEPGRPTATDDTVAGLARNPAALAGLPSWDVRGLLVLCPNSAQKVGCGYSLSAGSPLFAGLSVGLKLDYVSPPWGGTNVGVAFPYRGYDFGWMTWGLGYRANSTWSFGATIQHAFSANSYVSGLTGLSVGVNYRPYSHFGLSFVAHDLNNPSPRTLEPLGGPVLDRSYVAAMSFRPTGTRAVELAVEAKVLEANGEILPRAALGVDIPGLGRARADVELFRAANDSKRAVVGSVGLEVHLGRSHIGGGALMGSGIGSDATAIPFLSFGMHGYEEPGFAMTPLAVEIRMESTPGPRGHVALLRRLWGLAHDPNVRAVTLVLRSEPSTSFARAEEVADALRFLRAHGKKTLCSLEAAGSRSLYVCANADRTVIHPAGGIRYAGLSNSYLYLAKLLANVGVKAEFVRIGAHKSAPEQLMNEGPSPVAKRDHDELLAQQEAVFVRNLSMGRKLSEARVRSVTRQGPFVASEAREAGFVDGYAFDDEVERVTKELVGAPVSYVRAKPRTLAPQKLGSDPGVAILYLEGDIVDGRSRTVPLIGIKTVGSYSFAESVRKLRDDPSIRAVVLRIESPGGSSMASDVMYRELTLLARKKPLVVSMGSVAASGGYYAAMASPTVYALPLTITGSIGVFYGKADGSELLRKIGVNIDTIKTAPRADAESLYRPFTEDERAELRRKVAQFYDQFLERVSAGRKRSKQSIDQVAQGKVWTGQEAKERGLVDHIGGLRHALDEARRLGNLPADCPIHEAPSVETTLVQKLIGLIGGLELEPIKLPADARNVGRAMAPLLIHETPGALMRLEWVDPDESVAP